MTDRLPPPPSPLLLRGVRPDIHLLHAGTLLWRIYFRGGPHPSGWGDFRSLGPTGARFDHHLPPRREQRGRSILYLSASGAVCVAELFGDTRLIDRTRDSPALVAFRTARPLRLLDLTGAWPARAGASPALSQGRRGTAPLWSRAIHAAYPEIEGLRYASARDQVTDTFALYERARSAVPAAPALDRALVDPLLAGPLRVEAQRLGYAMV
jgi:hypothetical protein